MIQPEHLKTDAYVEWCNGAGNLVWAMLEASYRGDLATVQALAAQEPSLLWVEEGYRPPIYFAVREGHDRLVDWLIDQGADIAIWTGGPWYESLVGMARLRGHRAIVERLEREQRERWGIRPEGAELAELARRRDVAALLARIDAEPELLVAADDGGSQPIHWAALTRNLALLDALLARGADIDARRADGARPAELAFGDYHYRTWYRETGRAMGSHQAVIGWLLARGAEHDLVTCAFLDDVEQAERLLDADPSLATWLPPCVGYYSGYPLRLAAKNGYLRMVSLLLDRGADPNLPERGVAPRGGALQEAVGSGNEQMVRRLLDAGADPNQLIESSGNTLFTAEYRGHQHLIPLLIEHGAEWPLWYCVEKNLVEVVQERFRERPETADPREFYGAVRSGRDEIVAAFLQVHPHLLETMPSMAGDTPERTRRLLAGGMDPSRPDWLGATALHHLAGRGEVEQMAVLIEHGAELEAVDDEYRATPLGWAARLGQLSTIEYLLDHGADPNGAGAPWSTPLGWAEHAGQEEAANVLRRRGAAMG